MEARMKEAIILVGAAVVIACIATVAQNEGERVGVSAMPWLFGGPQGIPVTAPTGRFPTNPARGAQPVA
jgi:hypothetical protein